MNDKDIAKALAKAHKTALEQWNDPLLEDTVRPRIRAMVLVLAEKRQEHMDKTGWSYDVPAGPGERGRWSHSTGPKWSRQTVWITDEEETGQ